MGRDISQREVILDAARSAELNAKALNEVLVLLRRLTLPQKNASLLPCNGNISSRIVRTIGKYSRIAPRN